MWDTIPTDMGSAYPQLADVARDALHVSGQVTSFVGEFDTVGACAPPCRTQACNYMQTMKPIGGSATW